MSVQTEGTKWVKGPTGPKLNPEYVALWESYLDEGMSAKAVGEIFGVSKMTVLRHYPGRGWNAQQRLEHSLAVKALARI